MGKHRRTVPREELEKVREAILEKLDHDGPPVVGDLVLKEQLDQIDDEIKRHY